MTAFAPVESVPSVLLRSPLRVGAVDDPLEVEAERVAERVMRTPSPDAVVRRCPGGCPDEEVLRRQPLDEEEDELLRSPADGGAPGVVSGEAVGSGGGGGLPPGSLRFFEPRLGVDLSGVRVHHDRGAARLAASVNARAFTVGRDVFFGAGEWAPGTARGDRLLAHELTHTIQTDDTVRRQAPQPSAPPVVPAPSPKPAPPPAPTCPPPQAPDDHKMDPPSIKTANPLDRMAAKQTPGKTFFKLNTTVMPEGVSMGALLARMIGAMGLPPIVSTPAAGGGPVSCCFGPGFKVVGGTDVLIAEPPGPSGWQAGLNPDAVLLPADRAKCAGKINVPVTMRGDPDDATFEAAVRAGEMEHVAALEALHTKHLVPHYRFITSATAQAATDADCRTALISQVTGRDDQAATGFILGDLAETRRFDDPVSGTHHSNSIPNVPAGCASISLLTSLSSPQRPGLGPGNVAVVAATVTRVDPAKLAVSGNDLVEGTTVVRTLGSAAEANRALAVFQGHKITEIHSVGSFSFLLAKGVPPKGALGGETVRTIDPALYQVTFGATAPSNWAIVEAQPGQVFVIHDFGAKRDEAYSAIELMRSQGFNREVFIGSATNPSLRYFRTD